MEFKPKIKDDAPVNSSLSLSLSPSPPPPISTSTPRYSNTQLTPFSHNYATQNNVEWPANHPNQVLNHVSMDSIPHWSSSSNQTKNLTKSDLHLEPHPNLSKTQLNRNPIFGFDSDTNQNQKKIRSILQLGLEKNHDPNKVNSIVSPLSSSAQWFHNRISSSLNQVEKVETSRSEIGGLTLNQNMIEPVSNEELVRVEPVKRKLDLVQPQSKEHLVLVHPISKNELKEPDEPIEKKQNQLDLTLNGSSKVSFRSPVKAKGFGEIKNVAIEGEGERDGSREKEEEKEVETEIFEISKTWNLRSRKLVTKPGAKVNNRCSGGGCSRMGVASTRVSKPRSMKSRARPSSERPTEKEKRGLTFNLTKEEIEHDFMLMTGEKTPKKPFQRPKISQKNIEVLFPGMHLTNITPEKYKVNDNPPPRKC